MCVFSLLIRWTGRINILTGTYHDRSDGSVFYRYSDGSKYYRHKNGNIQFSPPAEPHEKAEGADTTVSRLRYDWPPQLDLSIKTDGTFAIIRDASGSMVAFEPVGANAGAGLAPVHDRSVSPFHNFDNPRSLIFPSVGAPLRGRHTWTVTDLR